MNMREARKKKGLTQTKIAELLGVNQNTYSYWENGKTRIDHFTLAKLAEIFEVSTDFLLGIENKTKRNLLNEIRDYSNITMKELALLKNIPIDEVAAFENEFQELYFRKNSSVANVKSNIFKTTKNGLPRFSNLNNKYEQKNIPILNDEIWSAEKLSFEKFNCESKMFAVKCINCGLEKFRIFLEDYLIISKQNYVEHNQIVAVVIENTFQIRRYLKKNNIIILESGNEEMETIAFMAGDLKKIKIIGLVVEVVRIF